MEETQILSECPLALKPFTTIEFQSGICPNYTKLATAAELFSSTTAEDSSKAFDFIKSKDQLEQLEDELKLIKQSASFRGRQALDELKKVDEFIKVEAQKLNLLPKAAAPNDPSLAAVPSSVPTIKLKLKTADVNVTENLKDKALQKRMSKPKTLASHVRSSSPSAASSNNVVKRQREDDTSSVYSGSIVTNDNKKCKVENAPKPAPPESINPEPAAASGDAINKIKPSQQIPMQTFWNYIDAFFRPINQSDINFLDIDNDDPLPYIIPPLGRHYHAVWAEEERSLLPGSSSIPAAQHYKQKRPSSVTSKNANFDPDLIEEQTAIVESYSGGSISERLVSSLLEEKDGSSEVPEIDNSSDQDDGDHISYKDPNREEIYSIEQRLKRELKFLGLLDSDDEYDSNDNSNDREDEITLEMRRLQSELRRLSTLNNERMRIVKEKAIERMAFQEYNSILDELNKQIEQLFMKRQKIFSRKKKRSSAIGSEGNTFDILDIQKVNIPFLERRKRLIQDFEPIFPTSKFQIPTDSIFNDEGSDWIPQISLDPIVHREIIEELEKKELMKRKEKEEKLKAPEEITAVNPESLVEVAKESNGDKSKTKPSTTGIVTVEKPKKKQPAKPRKKKDPSIVDGGDGESSVTTGDKPPRKKRSTKPKKTKENELVSADSFQTDLNQLPDGQLPDGSPSFSNQDPSSFFPRNSMIPDWMYNG